VKKFVVVTIGLGLSVFLSYGVWYWLQREPLQGPKRAAAPTTEPAHAPAMTDASASSESGIQHPIAVPDPAASAVSAVAAPDVESALSGLFGRKSVQGVFQLDDFARRVVATVDNLGRTNAPARLWPVNPADGRFQTEQLGDAEVISADNGLRYTPYVLLLETVDLKQVASVYAKLYPAFQTAYEELGYPTRYFNDRVLEVFDQLIATPDFDAPVKVRLPVINGPLQPPRPWVLYEFEDPALQSLSAGQKIMLRTGPVNERRLKARLVELRRLLATATPGR
jgi:hypothetical protein